MADWDKEVVMNKNKKIADGDRRPLVGLSPLIFIVLVLGVALSACTKVEVTPPAYELKL